MPGSFEDEANEEIACGREYTPILDSPSTVPLTP
jgi:hypothetical protein